MQMEKHLNNKFYKSVAALIVYRYKTANTAAEGIWILHRCW